MKNKIFLYLFSFLIIVAGCKKKHADSWILIWEDEFDNSEINWEMWSKTPRGKSNWNDAMSDDELYNIRDGKLILRGIKINYSVILLYLTWNLGKRETRLP